MRGIHRGPVNSPHKWPVTWKIFPFDDVIIRIKMTCQSNSLSVAWISNYVNMKLWDGIILPFLDLMVDKLLTYGLTLTHWGRVTHICVSKLTIIGSDNGLSPGRPQAIIWTNVWILLIRTLGTNFSEILSEIHTFSFKKMHLKMSSGKWRPFCLGLNVLTTRKL